MGSLERWNDGKKAERQNRVKHDVKCNFSGVYSVDEKAGRKAAKKSRKSMTGKK